MTLFPNTHRAALNVTAKANDPAVSVISYPQGERTQKEIDIKTAANGPVKPAIGDESRLAEPMNPNVYSQLTPTLHKFTLRNKVAVITGYAPERA